MRPRNLPGPVAAALAKTKPPRAARVLASQEIGSPVEQSLTRALGGFMRPDPHPPRRRKR